MSDQYILAIDQGTTSSRAIIYNHNSEIIGKDQKEFTQLYPKPGWVEHNPKVIWSTTLDVIDGSLKDAGITAGDLAAIGITNQRETTVVWDKNTGEPVYNAIVWQCRRTTDICQQLKEKDLEPTFQEKTGLVLDPYFSGTKVKWILDNVEGVRERAEQGQLLFGTIDSWLIWKLTNGRVHVTDYTNASRTLMFNIYDLEWDQELLDILGIPESMLPEVKSSSQVYGKTEPEHLFGEQVPIAGIAGDQQAATFAQACYDKGMTKITYGTGAFMVMNTGTTPVPSENGLLTTIAWGCDDEISYALEGSIFIAGAAIQWLRDELGLLDDAVDSEYFARKVGETDGVYLVPAFTGLGAPHWNPEARGMLVGLTRGSNKSHIIRAALESLVYQSEDLIQAMIEDSGISLRDVRVDGGASANDFILQFLADITDTNVERPGSLETTSAGSAYLAGLAVDFWDDRQEIIEARTVDKTFEPQMSEDRRQRLLEGWQQAIDTTLYWSRHKHD